MNSNFNIAAAALAAYTHGVYAQSATVPVGPTVIVTATRTAENMSEAHAQASVISAAQIRAGGYATLTEVLQAHGGVEITRNGGPGQPSAVFMRGAEARHTLVLIDGLRVGSATAGGTAFEHIAPAQIERIEIVPGPLSGVYGADAIGGVIQIFTRGAASGTSAKVSVGSFGTREVAAGFGRRIGNSEFSLAAGYSETRGFDATKPNTPFAQYNPDRDGYRNRNVSARWIQHLTDGHELGATAFHSRGDTHFDAGLATDDVRSQTVQAFSLYSRNRITPNWTSLLRIGSARDHSASVGAFPGYFRTDQHQVLWQHDVRLSVGTLIGGVEFLSQRVASDTPYSGTRRDVKSAFLGYRGDFGAHGFQANGRRDDNSQFGAQHTGSLGYSYRFTRAWRARMAAGTAFKAPTFNDLYFPDFPPFYFSNPDLRPERSRGREVGINYDGAQQQFAATLFRNRISNLITVVTDPVTFVSTTRNLNSARIDGVALAWRAQIQAWQLRANATLQDPRDDATGAQLRRRAKYLGSAAAEKTTGPWRVGAEVVASGARFDSTTEAPNTRLHGYALLNLTARYALTRDWALDVRWGNVFNREYESARFFNDARGNGMVALVYQPRSP
ncbi:MAG: TonB-dependent receptor [Betaproteobacteria bacterium]|nr:TonB-dependent receptor [Betaproteobacteria bacterium]